MFYEPILKPSNRKTPSKVRTANLLRRCWHFRKSASLRRLRMILIEFATWREIVRVDEEIDRRVYILYGLTEEEIKIVEG